MCCSIGFRHLRRTHPCPCAKFSASLEPPIASSRMPVRMSTSQNISVSCTIVKRTRDTRARRASHPGLRPKHTTDDTTRHSKHSPIAGLEAKLTDMTHTRKHTHSRQGRTRSYAITGRPRLLNHQHQPSALSRNAFTPTFQTRKPKPRVLTTHPPYAGEIDSQMVAQSLQGAPALLCIYRQQRIVKPTTCRSTRRASDRPQR